MSVELSVIIPTFNRPQQTARAVAAALAQDVALEVIVVDDGSEPSLRMDDAASNVKILRLDRNAGAAAARNAGVAHASAGWIAFLDSDDVWPVGGLRPRFEAARRSASPENVIWTAGFVDVWERQSTRVRLPREARDPSDFVSGCWTCPGSTAILSRSAWERSGGQDPALRRLEDYEWLLRWGLQGGRLSVFDGVGAEISRGGRADPETIRVAAQQIRVKHAALAAPLRRRMESYLQLELGAAFLHRGAIPEAAIALGRSWVLHPRLQPALEPFWRRPA